MIITFIATCLDTNEPRVYQRGADYVTFDKGACLAWYLGEEKPRDNIPCINLIKIE